MRNFFLLFLTGLLLVSCGTPVATSSPTATIIPSTQTPAPTTTPIPTNTPSLTPEPTPVLTIWDIDREFFLKNMIEISGELNGIPMNVKWGFDKSQIRITQLVLKSANEWKDDQTGYTSEQAWMNFFQQYMYQVWKGSNPNVINKSIQDTSFESYIKIVSEINAGIRQPEDGIVTGFANDLTTDGYDLERHAFSPFLVNGENQILNFEIILVNASRVKNLQKFDDGSTFGFGMNYDPNTKSLIIYQGVSINDFAEFIIANLSAITTIFKNGSTPRNFNDILIKAVSNPNRVRGSRVISNGKTLNTSMKFLPEDDYDKRFNR
jgi:hypothetical protein